MMYSTPAFTENQPSVDEIIKGLSYSAKLLLEEPKSFKIVCAREEAKTLGPKGDLLLAEWITVRKGDNWFTQSRCLNPSPEYSFGEDSRVRVTKGKKGSIEWTKQNRQCGVHGSEEIWNLHVGWEYFQILGFDVYRYIAESCGVDYENIRHMKVYEYDLDRPYLPEFLEKNRSHYHVLSEPENVDGFLCWIVEWPGMDRLWVDPEHGFAVRRRAYHWGPGKPLRYDISQKDFREVRPGLWLPFTQIVDHYAIVPSADEKWWGKVINKAVYKLKEIEFDNVPDNLFDVHLPPGTRVTDSIRKVQYATSADNADPFSPALAVGNEHLQRATARLWTIVVTGSLLLILIVILVIRMWRRMGV